jgi:hypothetical protein
MKKKKKKKKINFCGFFFFVFFFFLGGRAQVILFCIHENPSWVVVVKVEELHLYFHIVNKQEMIKQFTLTRIAQCSA